MDFVQKLSGIKFNGGDGDWFDGESIGGRLLLVELDRQCIG